MNETNDIPEPQFVINLDELPKAELAGHQWLQMGTQLLCQSCPFTHATHIDTGYQLYGINDEGLPLIRRINVSV